ncbi:MAG TPA: cation diffusion facilitator family transporter [Microbacteriaceae bacterium]|nr:cation diffusion facilitator family transporter [Microbacteriaceae bacterium]
MGAAHAHGASSGRARIAIALGITVAVLAAELVGAWLTGSLALLTDAAHMVTDAVGLSIAFGASIAVASRPNDRRTWGLRRVEVLAALLQALLLIAVAIFVVVEAIARIGASPDIPAAELLLFAVIGLLGNLVAIAVLAGGRGQSLNLRAAFLEVVADALGSVAVIIAAIVIWTTGFAPADSIAAIAIGAFIVPRAIRLAWDALAVVLEVTPKDLDLASVREHLEAMEGVRSVHDLHVSRISTDLPVLTAHVVVDDAWFRDGRAPQLLTGLQECVASHFAVSIEHSTFQLESDAHPHEEHVAHA